MSRRTGASGNNLFFLKKRNATEGYSLGLSAGNKGWAGGVEVGKCVCVFGTPHAWRTWRERGVSELMHLSCYAYPRHTFKRMCTSYVKETSVTCQRPNWWSFNVAFVYPTCPFVWLSSCRSGCIWWCVCSESEVASGFCSRCCCSFCCFVTYCCVTYCFVAYVAAILPRIIHYHFQISPVLADA